MGAAEAAEKAGGVRAALPRTEHWRCSCGAFGHSNSWDANAVIKARHIMAGHVVESWERGRRNETLIVATTEEET